MSSLNYWEGWKGKSGDDNADDNDVHASDENAYDNDADADDAHYNYVDADDIYVYAEQDEE